MDDGTIIEIAKSRGAWVHVDGAFGLWVGACQTKKALTQGYELADSWATDGYKWLNVPYDSGLVICKNGLYLRKAMSIFGDYLDQSGARIPCQYTPELSRRARAIDLWAVLRTLGKVGVDELVSRTCQYAEHVAKTLDSAGFEVLNKIETNQVLVSFGRDPETTHRVIRGFQTQGICWCGGTVWKGKTAMRISVSSFKTTADDIERSLQAILTVARQIAGTVLTTREGEIDQP